MKGVKLLVPVIIIFAPKEDIWKAISFPIPPVEPVKKTTLFFKENMSPPNLDF